MNDNAMTEAKAREIVAKPEGIKLERDKAYSIAKIIDDVSDSLTDRAMAEGYIAAIEKARVLEECLKEYADARKPLTQTYPAPAQKALSQWEKEK